MTLKTKQTKVLITGTSGLIGRIICPFLEAKGYHIRAYDRCDCNIAADSVKGTLAEISGLRKAMAGVDVVVHLAACSDDADFVTHLVPANVIGLYNVLQAIQLEKIRRFIFASSCQAADLLAEKQSITAKNRHPTDHYGLTKLWGEEMTEMYSRLFGIAVLAVRLGWVIRDSHEFEEIRTIPHGTKLFLSRPDLRRFFYCALSTSIEGFEIVYALSKQTHGEVFDMKATERLLGFKAADEFPRGALDF